jgi:hypothetical protein
VSPLITLLTDFGHQDSFVGVMKGVILALCPSATLVDLCHEVRPHDVLGGSFVLQTAVPYFPPGTIHVVVVDPGVGGSRRAILAMINDQLFVAPDNGLLSYPMAHGAVRSLRAISARKYMLPQVSATFHGRDVFAPVAGHLARGVPPEEFGPEVSDPVCLPIPRPRLEASRALLGEVVWIDRFGNCITNITAADLDRFADSVGGEVEIFLDGRSVGPVGASFIEVSPGGRGGIIGSTGHLELFRYQGNLAGEWGVGPGRPVRVHAAAPRPHRGAE